MVKKRAKEENIKLKVIFVGTVKRLKKKKKRDFKREKWRTDQIVFLKKNIMC